MVDAGDLKSPDRMVMWVRFPPPAPFRYNNLSRLRSKCPDDVEGHGALMVHFRSDLEDFFESIVRDLEDPVGLLIEAARSSWQQLPASCFERDIDCMAPGVFYDLNRRNVVLVTRYDDGKIIDIPQHNQICREHDECHVHIC